jgi:hypothetical protein
MSDIQIPEHEWQHFCASFTRQHHGWLVGVHQLDTRVVESGGTGVQQFAGHRTFQEVREANRDGVTEVMVTVGEGSDEMSFLISDAVALYKRMSGDLHQGLRIDSGNGETTLVEFRAPADPAALDGLAETER